MVHGREEIAMKRIFLASIVMASILYAGPLLAAENMGPRIEVKEIQHDFGKVVQGMQASYVFGVRNIGNEPLVIERVVPS
jgi:Protein of unknown function (DUF1573)